MAMQIPVYGAHSHEVIAQALVDEDDYERVVVHRWVMQGDPESPRYVYRYRCSREREADEPTTIGLAQSLMPAAGRITFRNGNHLDCRKANLLRLQDRERHHAGQAEGLMAATHTIAAFDTEGSIELPLTRGWIALIDSQWEARLSRYSWRTSFRKKTVYAQRQIKLPGGGSRTIYLHRVIAGLQAMDDGAERGGGVVAFKTPPDRNQQCIDLRASNLIVTTRAGSNLNQPLRVRYRGVGRQGSKYRATIKLGGQDRIVGLFDTPEDAARARDAEIIRLGLVGIARLNEVPPI